MASPNSNVEIIRVLIPHACSPHLFASPHALLAALHHNRHRLPHLLVREASQAKVLIDVQHDLERVAATTKRSVVELVAQTGERLYSTRRRLVARVRDRPLQELVRGEGEAELRRRAHDTRGSALEEGRGALLLENRPRRVGQALVRRLALARLDLQARLDHVEGRGEVRGGHASDGTG